MRFKYTSVAILFGLLGSWLDPLMAQAQSRVQVHVTDAFGNPVPANSIMITGARSTTEALQDQTITLAYGEYTVEVSVPGAAPAKMSALIDQPAQILTVGMRLGKMEADPPPCTILGHIAPEVKALRMRVVQLFGSYVTDVPVATGDQFEVRNLECGDYLLIAMGRAKLLGTMAVKAAVMPVRVEMRANPN